MIEEMQSEKMNDTGAASNFVSRPPLLQRKCACGGSAGLSGTCDKCLHNRLTIQNYSLHRHTLESSLAGLAQPLSSLRPVLTSPLIQRAAADENSGSTESPTSESEETEPLGLIAEDDATEVAPHQMRKSDFLAQLSSEISSTAEPILATRGRTAANCPYIVNWIDYGYTRSGHYVETFVRRFATGTTAVASAAEYIPLVKERLRAALLVWAETGRITGVPSDLATDVIATNRRTEVERLGERVESPGETSPAETVLAKAVDGVSTSNPDPRTVQNQLSGGTALDNGTRQRMESALGYSFSRVRVHHDPNAASLATRLHARAFTVGHDIAFAAGEYNPGTLIGDALLAHELAHVVQQGAATSSELAPKSSGSSASGSLETDADRSAVGAVVKLWGRNNSRLADLKNNAFPRLRSGLRLSRCESCSCNTREEEVPEEEEEEDPRPSPTPDPTPTPVPPPSVCNLTPTTEDQAVLDQINLLAQADQLSFLTGRLDPTSTTFTTIQSSIEGRVNNKVGALNAIRPGNLPALTVESHYRGFRRNPRGTRGSPQAQIVFEKFFLTGGRRGGWDSFPAAYRAADGTPDRTRWLATPTLTRLQEILRYSAVPGASRHHWFTDVDFNSTTTSHWVAPGTLAPLGTWLSANACREGFVQAYTPGRSGGHAEEQWHYSYAPIAIGVRQLYSREVLTQPARLESEVLTPIINEFTRRASAAGETMPADFETGLRALNIAEYVNTIESSL